MASSNCHRSRYKTNKYLFWPNRATWTSSNNLVILKYSINSSWWCGKYLRIINFSSKTSRFYPAARVIPFQVVAWLLIHNWMVFFQTSRRPMSWWDSQWTSHNSKWLTYIITRVDKINKTSSNNSMFFRRTIFRWITVLVIQINSKTTFNKYHSCSKCLQELASLYRIRNNSRAIQMVVKARSTTRVAAPDT